MRKTQSKEGCEVLAVEWVMHTILMLQARNTLKILMGILLEKRPFRKSVKGEEDKINV
jgi:hypothetical protein